MRRRTFLQAVLGNLVFFSVSLEKNGRSLEARRESVTTPSPSSHFSFVFSTPPISPRPAANDRFDENELRPGDVLAARWADERKNSTPGYWNHLGIVGSDATQIVEAQEPADGAISTPVDAFFKRYSKIAVARYFRFDISLSAALFAERRVVRRSIATPLRWENDKSREHSENRDVFKVPRRTENAESVPKSAQTGPHYSRFASIWPRVDENAESENCVSLVRRAYFAASGVDYRWRTPDSLFLNVRTDDFRILGNFETTTKSTSK